MLTVIDPTIDKDVPLPLPGNKTGVYAGLFEKMEIGDSVEMPIAYRSVLSMAKNTHKKKTGKVFTIRTLSGKQNFRLWRTE